jgi:hypothetical protein
MNLSSASVSKNLYDEALRSNKQIQYSGGVY